MKEPWQMTQREYVAKLQHPKSGLVVDTSGMLAKLRAKIDRETRETHRWYVTQAIGRGEQVPAKVLADYPDLQRQYYKGLGEEMVEKEPWQMTKKEFCLGRAIPPTLSPHWVIRMAEGPAMRFKTISAAFNWLHKEHKLWVKYAISEGKPVPAEVLADYPDLQKRYGGLGMSEKYYPLTKEPWQMTVKEWKALPDDIQDTFAGEYPPYPYHSNFHLVQVIDAIREGKPVPLRVIESYGRNTALELALKGWRPAIYSRGLGMSERMTKIEEARKIVLDAYDYFIKGYSKKADGGLNDLFYQVWVRESGKDYYPAVSALALDAEVWLANPGEWTEDEILHFAAEFQQIVSDSPNYPIENNFQTYYRR